MRPRAVRAQQSTAGMNPKGIETMPLLPEPADLLTVHRAATEFEAMTIRDLLETAGIRAMVRSRQVRAMP